VQINQQMFQAATPFCDQFVQSRAPNSIVRQTLWNYYNQDQNFRSEYIQTACVYAQVLMNSGHAWQNAISAAAEAVSPIFIVNLANRDGNIANAFQQNMAVANETQQLANSAMQVIRSATQPQTNMGMMQQPMGLNVGMSGMNTTFNQSPLSGALVSPSVNVGVNLQRSSVQNGITLPVPGSTNNQAVQNQEKTASNKQVGNVSQQNTNLLDAQPGLPPLFDRTKTSIEYIKHNGSDYFKETNQMDPNAHNHSSAFVLAQADEAVATIVSNDPITGTNGLIQNSSIYKIDKSEDPSYTRALFNDESQVYVIADLPDLTAEQIHITHMPTLDMVMAADIAKASTGVEASAVRDSELIEKIIYGGGQNIFDTVSEIFKNSKNIVDMANQLKSTLDRYINSSYSAQNQNDEGARSIIRINSTIRAFIKILNNYIRTASKKPNLPVNVFDEITDVQDLMKWLDKADNALHRTLMEQVQFQQWLNHNFIMNVYEGADNLTIESRKAVVYSTMVFHQLGVSFADGCDKAILTEEINPWLYYLFASHLQSSAGKRLYCSTRYFFSDDVTVDVTVINSVMGTFLVKLVTD
jgi:hypothetical protein